MLEITRRIAETRRDITDRAYNEGYSVWLDEASYDPERNMDAQNSAYMMRTYGTVEQKIAFLQGYSDSQKDWLVMNADNREAEARRTARPGNLLLINGQWHEP